MPRRITTRSSAKAKKSTLKKSSKKAKITAKLLPASKKKNVVKRRTTRSQVRKKALKKTIKKNDSSQINGLLDTVIGDVFGKMNRTAMLEEKEAREFEKERKIRLKKFMAGELSDDEYEQPSTSKKFKASGSRKPFPWERVKEMAKKTANLHKRNAILEENEDSDENAQKTCPIDNVPLNYGVPYEKLIDILKFVDRHESEKCLLVSKRWSSIVASSEKNLPCREKIQIYNTNNVFWLKRKGSAQERITESKAEILRKCLCTKFEILRFNDEVMKELEQVSKFAGRQIATNEVHFTVDDDFDEMGILKFLPKILKKIIRAQKVVLILKAKVLNMIFKNPGLLTIPDPPREVDLKAAPSYYVYGGKYSDATGICASVKVGGAIT
uniref:F-box domain-containing protein n=1 Tax=Acrobeloides nanus TaxID=290746 RepID=A0A914DF98_9BILA